MVMDDNENPRVQAHAGAALVNFSEDCPKAILAPYLDSIMAKLEAILSAKFNGKTILDFIMFTFQNCRSLQSWSNEEPSWCLSK